MNINYKINMDFGNSSFVYGQYEDQAGSRTIYKLQLVHTNVYTVNMQFLNAAEYSNAYASKVAGH